MNINVQHIAKLANLPLKKEDEEKLAKQLEETLTYIERLGDIDTTAIAGTNTVTGLENVMDEDIAVPSLSQDKALQNAKHTHNGFIVVPAIMAE